MGHFFLPLAPLEFAKSCTNNPTFVVLADKSNED
jgi:hypothetical protein